MKVPGYNPQTRPSRQALVGPSGQGATPDAFGAGIGRGLGAAAQGVGILANVVSEQDKAVRRTKSLRNFSAFQTRVNDRITELSRNHDPAIGNFSDIARAEYSNLEAEFLNDPNQVDPEFREEFAVRTGEMGTGIAGKTLAFQIESNDKWFRDQLNAELESSRIALGQNGTPEEFDNQLAKMEEMLASSGLSPAEQEMQLRTYRKALGTILYKEAQVRRIAEEDETGGAVPAAAEIIGAFSGGTEQEQQILAAEGEQLAVQSIGSLDLWAAMPARARAALSSLASDLGELPPEVVQAVMRGDLLEVSEAIRELGGDRRIQEADLVLDPGAQLDDDPRFSEVPYEDRLALLEDAKATVLAQETAATKAENAQNEALINALKVNLFDGSAGQMEIDALREMGVLTKYEDIAAAQKIYDDRNANLQLTAQGQSMLAQGIEFNPLDDDHKKILNAMLGEQGIKALQSRDGNYAANTLIPLVRQSRDIPTDAIGTLLGMMRSNDQDDALWALDALSQLEQASPRAYDMRTDEDTASAVELWRTRKDFYPPDELLKLINGGLTTAERQQTKLLRDEARDLLKDDKLGPKLDPSIFQTGVWGTPNSTPSSWPQAAKALESDFNRLFEDQYPLYGNVEDAKKAALTLLDKVWGATRVGNDGKVMKFPPEKYYPPVAGSYDWMERQLRSEGVVAEDESFELIGDAQTEKEVDDFRRGGPPVSYLVVKVKDGQPSLVMQGGANVDPFGNVVEITPVVPIRKFFDITPLEQADEAAWREERNAQFSQEDLFRALGLAESHSLETGIPIPPDSDAAEGMGIVEYMMQEEAP